MARGSRDDYHAAHLLVPLAAEDIAGEVEAAGLRRCERYAHRSADDDVGMQAEARRIEAHVHVLGGELEHHRLAHPELDLARRELELLRVHGDHPRFRLRPRYATERARERQNEEEPPVHALTTGNSVSFSAFGSASTLRKPRPWYGCAGFHATGARFGTEPGAG